MKMLDFETGVDGKLVGCAKGEVDEVFDGMNSFFCNIFFKYSFFQLKQKLRDYEAKIAKVTK